MRKLDDYVTKNLDRISTYIFGSHIALYGRTLPSHIAHHVFTINEFLALRGLDEIIPANSVTKFKNQVKNAYLSNKLACPNEEHKFVKADNNYPTLSVRKKSSASLLWIVRQSYGFR